MVFRVIRVCRVDREDQAERGTTAWTIHSRPIQLAVLCLRECRVGMVDVRPERVEHAKTADRIIEIQAEKDAASTARRSAGGSRAVEPVTNQHDTAWKGAVRIAQCVWVPVKRIQHAISREAIGKSREVQFEYDAGISS